MLAQADAGDMDSAAHTEAFNAFLAEDFANRVLARSPELRTFLGSRDGYGEWSDASLAFEAESLELQGEAVAAMQARFDRALLDRQAQISYDLFIRSHEQAKALEPYRLHGYTFNQMGGRQSGAVAFLINQHRVESFDDAMAYLQRLEGFDEMMAQYVERARQSELAGVLPPRFVLEHVLRDARNVVTGAPFQAGSPSPLLADFLGKIDALEAKGGLSAEERDAMEKRARFALEAHVGPAYDDLIAFIEGQRARADARDGVWKLPDGEAYYAERLKLMTTTDMTAEEIHQLGLAEVARIHDEMRQIMAKVGYDGSLGEFFEFMRDHPRFYYPATDEGRARYLAEATALIETMEANLDQVFAVKPKAELVVKRVEEFREKSAGKAFYQRPAADGSRPGVYYANLYDMGDMPIYQMEALAYHEGVPGHHMQIAIAQELEGVPEFRRFGGFTVYSEGWGLYSEYLPKEMGFYQDPYSDFGRLAMELWRAARLVVDTGLHDKRWTREEAIDYLVVNTPNAENDARKAIERYIVMPGQATAYTIGMIKILDLRARAMVELGEDFDIRAFHDVVLKDGAVPLSMLEEQVDAWIAAQRDA